MGDPTQRLLELDARHTELLTRLSELDERVLTVLDEWTKAKLDQQATHVESIPMTVSDEVVSLCAAA